LFSAYSVTQMLVFGKLVLFRGRVFFCFGFCGGFFSEGGRSWWRRERGQEGEGNIRSRNLTQMAGQPLEIPVPMHGNEVRGAVRALACTVGEELLQPREAPRAASDSRCTGPDTHLAQRFDFLDPGLGRGRGFDVAPSVGGRTVRLVERQHVADVGPGCGECGDLGEEGRVGETPQHGHEFEVGLRLGG